MYGDDGWYGFNESPYSQGALDTYYWSMDPADRKFIPSSEWLDFLDGDLSEFPVATMEQEFESINLKMRSVEEDTSSQDTRLSDNTLQFNTANETCLTQIMMGALTPRYGEPLHARVRYFDPTERRAGIPQDVAALVEGITDTTTTLSLANVNQVSPRQVIVQAGAYGEHQVASVEFNGDEYPVDRSFFTVELRPGTVSKIVIRLNRYVNQPTFTHPWDRS